MRDQALDEAGCAAWCRRGEIGAVVVFTGLVRDHAIDADGTVRRGVEFLDYEVYDEFVLRALDEVVAEARRRWPEIGPVAVEHRRGRVMLSESAVVVAVGAGHRGEAFDAARWVIDTLKASAPIWKYESWEEGGGWGTGAAPITPAEEVPR